MAERWLRGIVPRALGPLRAPRSAACWSGATSWTVWNQSTVNEKVYTVSLLSIALVMWLVVRWGDDEPGPAPRPLAGAHRLRAGAHLHQPHDGLAGRAGLVVYVLWTDWRVFTRPWVHRRRRSLAVVVGISLNYVWLPMRAGQYPPINEGEPIGFFSQALKDVLNRVQYGKPALVERQAELRRPARQLLAVLHLAVRPRLGRLSGVATASSPCSG